MKLGQQYNFVCSQVFSLHDGYQHLMAGQFEKAFIENGPRPAESAASPAPTTGVTTPPRIPAPPTVVPFESAEPKSEEGQEPPPLPTQQAEQKGEGEPPEREHLTADLLPDEATAQEEPHFIFTSNWQFRWSFPQGKMPIRPVGRLYYYSAGKEYFVNTEGITITPFEVDVVKFRLSRYERIHGTPPITPALQKLIEANTYYQIFDVILPAEDPPFRKFSLDSFFAKIWGQDVIDEVVSTRKNASLAEIYPQEYLDVYSYLRGQYENERLGPNIWSLSKLKSVNFDASEIDMFEKGILILSTDWYSIMLSRDVSQIAICLTNNYLYEGTLDNIAVEKALADFSSRANKMEFLKCEGVLKSPSAQ